MFKQLSILTHKQKHNKKFTKQTDTADGIQKDNILQKYIKHIKYIVVYSGKKYDIKVGDTRAGGEKVCDAKVFDIKEEAVVDHGLLIWLKNWSVLWLKKWSGAVIKETFRHKKYCGVDIQKNQDMKNMLHDIKEQRERKFVLEKLKKANL